MWLGSSSGLGASSVSGVVARVVARVESGDSLEAVLIVRVEVLVAESE